MTRGDHVRRGSSFIEIILSVVILSFIVMIAAGSLVSATRISYKMDNLVSTYYGAQGELEKEKEALIPKIRDYHKIEDAMQNMDPSNITQEMKDASSKLEKELDLYSPETVNIFGHDVTIYHYDVKGYTSGGAEIGLYSGTSYDGESERRVPILDGVEIHDGGSYVEEIYFGNDKDLTADAEYNSKNNDCLQESMYQWYISSGMVHTSEFSNGPVYDIGGNLYRTVQPSFPGDYVALKDEIEETLTVKDEYLGHLCVCTVTPFSKDSAIGRFKYSQAVYLSALPQLEAGSYEMFIDPSREDVSYSGKDSVSLDSISSRSGVAGLALEKQNKKDTFVLSLSGAPINWDGDPDNYLNEGLRYSRYIRYTKKESGKGGNGENKGKKKEEEDTVPGELFMIARDCSDDAVWELRQETMADYTVYPLAGSVDFAELIIVSEPSDEDIEAIRAYLIGKYQLP